MYLESLTAASALIRCALLGVALVVAGCATQRTPEAERAQLRMLRAELIASGDADSLAAAALLERFATGEWHDAPALTARATVAAPDRTELAFLQLVLCYDMPACAPEPLEARLRVLDPGNGITWLYVLARATRDHDAAGIGAALAGLAQAQRVAFYWTPLVFHMTGAVAGKAGFDERAALVEVIGIQNAFLSPPLQPVSKACSKEAITSGSVLAQCRRIFLALRQGDTELLQSFANHLGDRLWPEGSAEHTALDAERRVMDYRQSLWVAKQGVLASKKAARTLMRLYGQYGSEQEVFLALYASLGLNPDPPGHWKDPAQAR